MSAFFEIFWEFGKFGGSQIETLAWNPEYRIKMTSWLYGCNTFTQCVHSACTGTYFHHFLSLPIDHLPYIGSWKKPMQEKKGLVWAFSSSEMPVRSCCMGLYPQSIWGRWYIRKRPQRRSCTGSTFYSWKQTCHGGGYSILNPQTMDTSPLHP